MGSRLRRWVEGQLIRPDRQWTPLGRFLVYLGRLAVQSWRQFLKDNCLEKGSALAYTTVLSLVPIGGGSSFLARRRPPFAPGATVYHQAKTPKG